MVDPISSSTSAAQDAATSAAQSSTLSGALGTNSSLGEQDFLKLLVAQLKNQDPLAPQDNSQFVAQLAQFSSLQAAMGTNTRLDTISSQNQGTANSDAINLVGKRATVKGSLLTAPGSGQAVPINFTLAADAATTNVSVQDSTGKVVRTIPIGSRKAGIIKTSWDGRDDQGNVMPAGTYAVSVQATSAAGGAVSVAQETTGTVTSVAFDKGYPVLALDNGMQVPVSDLIEVDSSSPNPNP
ncbi:MAG: flagellar hook capping FlgD N-terminal domain-containing protein [Polyangiaceae bacterium]